MKFWIKYLLAAVMALGLVSGCGTNPVTGKSELNLVSTEQEISIGKQNYGPSRQAQGGDYVADPGVQRYVRSIGQRLAAVSDRKLPYEFSVINDSTPNAWALPGGKIAVNRGLLVEMESEAELAAVLGHEIVHAAARHGAQGMQRGLLLQGALIATSIALSDSEYRGMGLAGAQIGAGLVNQKYGRDAEREADYYGMHYMKRAGYDPREAVDLQETFVRLSEGRNQDWLSGLFASHPPSQERVENNKSTVGELGNPGGEVGRDRYRQEIARLIRTKPAYEAYDEATAAAKKGEHSKALSLVDKALKIEPDEALFHGLRGEILAEQGNKSQAKRELDRAVSLNPSYFKHYLARGFVRRDLGDKRGAQSDFERSVELLPSAEAQYGLGRLAMDQGRKAEAIGYFQKAAAVDTEVGKAAGLYLAKLDLPTNPGRYIKSGLTLDRNGYLGVVIQNDSSVSVSDIRLVIGRRTAYGLREDGAHRLRGTLRPNQRVTIRTDLGPMDARQARTFATAVTHATIVQ
jgi:predicted Zn-dependent protease